MKFERDWKCLQYFPKETVEDCRHTMSFEKIFV